MSSEKHNQDSDINKVRVRQTSPDETESMKNGGKVETMVEFKRTVGLLSAVSFNFGTMVGVGIFITPKGVLANTGSVGLCLIIWAVCGAVTMIQALCRVELGTLVRKSGGDYSYLMAAYGPLQRFLGPLPAFIDSWLYIVVSGPSILGLLSLTCAQYALTPFYEDGCGGPPVLHTKLFAAAVILILAAVNCLSANAGTRVQVLFTVTKLTAITVIVVGGVVRLIQGYTQNLQNGFDGTTSDFGKIALGFYQGIMPYSGASAVNTAIEEIINPSRNLPLTVYISVPLVVVCYLLMNISYFTVMSPQQLLASPAVATTWGNVVLKEAAFLIPLFVAMSSFGSVNSGIFFGGRSNVAFSRNGHRPQFLSMLHVNRFTPIPGIMLNVIIALLWLIPGNVTSFILATGFVGSFINVFTIVGLFVMRYTHRDVPRVYKVPIIFPILSFLLSIYLVVTPIIVNPQIEFLYSLIMIAVGLVLYTVFVFYKKAIPGMGYFTTAVQLFLRVTPARENLK